MSIPSNIAEGVARSSDKELLRSLYIARASLSELDTQVIISAELGYLADPREIDAKIDHIFALVGGFIHSIRARTD